MRSSIAVICLLIAIAVILLLTREGQHLQDKPPAVSSGASHSGKSEAPSRIEPPFNDGQRVQLPTGGPPRPFLWPQWTPGVSGAAKAEALHFTGTEEEKEHQVIAIYGPLLGGGKISREKGAVVGWIEKQMQEVESIIHNALRELRGLEVRNHVVLEQNDEMIKLRVAATGNAGLDVRDTMLQKLRDILGANEAMLFIATAAELREVFREFGQYTRIFTIYPNDSGIRFLWEEEGTFDGSSGGMTISNNQHEFSHLFSLDGSLPDDGWTPLK